MASYRTVAFNKLYNKLNPTIQEAADRAYANFKIDPKRVHYESKGKYKGQTIFGARVDGDWRVLGYESNGNT